MDEQRWHICASATEFCGSPRSSSTPNAMEGFAARSAMRTHSGSSALYTSTVSGDFSSAPTMLSWMRSISPTRSSWSRNRLSSTT